MAREMPDAIVLDLMLPGTDGLALTREVRTSSSVPILMLSARGEEIDRVVGLEVGADDDHREALQSARAARPVARVARAGRRRQRLRTPRRSSSWADIGWMSGRGAC